MADIRESDLITGVWIGYDETKTLGRGETGAAAALPVWIDVMKAYLARRGRENPPSFAAPGNIVTVQVDKGTGSVGAGENSLPETFISGTQPDGAAGQQNP